MSLSQFSFFPGNPPLESKEICDFVESYSDTIKVLLASKRNSLVLFLE